MKNIKSLAGLFVVLALLISSCKKEDPIGMDFKINDNRGSKVI